MKQQVAQIEVGAFVFWVQLQDALITRYRLLRPIAGFRQYGQKEVGEDLLGVVGKDAVELFLRRLDLPG